MNKVFLVTSSIQLREDRPFECYRFLRGYRSVFTAEQRLEQTKKTIESIRKEHPTDKIIIADTSNTSYKLDLEQFPAVEYYHLKDLFDTDTYDLITTHYHKCICESTLLNTYITLFATELKQYEFVVKVTGRYQVANIQDTVFVEGNKNKVLLKKPYHLDPDDWLYDALFTSETKRAGIVPHEYDQALYGFGIDKLEFMQWIYQQTISILHPEKMRYIDIEKVMYLLTRPNAKDIVHVDWNVTGFDGMSGDFITR